MGGGCQKDKKRRISLHKIFDSCFDKVKSKKLTTKIENHVKSKNDRKESFAS